MATEIEIKAWVDDKAALLGTLERVCVFEREYVKKDIYLHGPGGKPQDSWAHWGNGDAEGLRPQDFRLRIESEADEDHTTAVCTFKDRLLVDAVEVNREEEFAVSSARTFLELSARLGCRVFSCKVKRGSRYTYRTGTAALPDLVVELSVIEGLGTFIEVECVLSSDSAERAEAEKAIRSFFEGIGIPGERFESRPYAKLLADGGVNQCAQISELQGIDFASGPD
jgi:predicted adenylyl cyclase CyaB